MNRFAWLVTAGLMAVVGCSGAGVPEGVKFPGGNPDASTYVVELDAGDASDAGARASFSKVDDCDWDPLTSACPVFNQDTTCEAPDYVLNRDGTMSSTCCGLIWEANFTMDQVDWYQATDYCETLDTAGLQWRLPTVAELYNLSIPLNDSPEVPPRFDGLLKANPQFEFWSSTVRPKSNGAYYFYVVFQTLGPFRSNYQRPNISTYHAICVTGNTPGS